MSFSIPDDWQVPGFDPHVLRERSRRYCIVIPVINEGERIRALLRRMHLLKIYRMADIILADGGSTDGSLSLTVLNETSVRALLIKRGSGHLSAQLRMAYSWALTEGYEGIVTIDGNGKDSEESIPAFLDALRNGIDYAQASRFIRGGMGINTPPLRLVAIRFIHSPLVSLAARRWLTDTTQGFRAYSARYLLHPRVKPFRGVFDRYELLAYLSARASQLGLKVVELPTTRCYPSDSKPPTKIKGIKGNLDLMYTLFLLVIGRFNPQE